MKKIISSVIITLLICSGLNFVLFSTAEPTHVEETVSIDFSDPIIHLSDSTAFVELDECSLFTTEPGKPKLPVVEKTFTYPTNVVITEVSYSIGQIRKEPMQNQIELNPIPVPVGQNDKQFSFQSSFYDHPHPYPQQWISYDVGRGLVDGKRSVIVKVQCNPIQYYPEEHYIEKTESMTISIQYETTSEPTTVSTLADENYDLLILTPEEFESNLEPLAVHKENRNISTKIVTLDQIYTGSFFSPEGNDDQEMIKYFIKNAYDQWETEYVLLVGGKDHFPYRESHVYIGYHDDSEIIVSDLYYADLYDENGTFETWDTNGNNKYAEYNWSGQYDDLDLYPDVYIGRLACIESDQVDSVVDKIIAYETQESFKKSWFKNIILIGGDSFTPVHGDESGVNEGELANQHVLDAMDGFIGTKLWVSNAKLAGFNPTGVDRIMDSIDAGCGFVHFSGHGSPNVWTTYPHNGTKQNMPTPLGSYRTDHIDALQNGYDLPIVVTGACSVGKFQKNDRCFSWSFVSNPNGGGIASFGATGLGYACLGWEVTDYVIEKMALEMFKAYNVHEAKTVGEMWATAIMNYITPELYDSDYKTIEEWQPFCDPSLALREDYITPSEPPNSPTLTGPSTGKPGVQYTFNATTTDPDRNQVSYLFDWGDGSLSEWIGPVDSGTMINASHSWEDKANFTVRVKAKDEHGYESDWSNPLVVSMPHVSVPWFLQWIIDVLSKFFPVFSIIN